MSKLVDALAYADTHVEKRSDINTEIQHPTDLIGMEPYFTLTLFLLKLRVVPADIHLITSKFWEGYTY